MDMKVPFTKNGIENRIFFLKLAETDCKQKFGNIATLLITFTVCRQSWTTGGNGEQKLPPLMILLYWYSRCATYSAIVTAPTLGYTHGTIPANY